MNNNWNVQPHTPMHRLPGAPPATNRRIDTRAQLLHRLQEFFEVSRDQFDESDLRIPEWRQADAALERAYDACVAREPVPAVQHLCTITRHYIEMAVEMSTARSYYDGRV
jgi:hypothetical protein